MVGTADGAEEELEDGWTGELARTLPAGWYNLDAVDGQVRPVSDSDRLRSDQPL